MRLLDELRLEHRLIDRVAGSLVAWADRGADHPDACNDLDDLVGFLRGFVHAHHHRQEEELFRALVEHGEIPGHRGPLPVLRSEHEAVARAVEELERLGPDGSAPALARQLAADIWQHLDKEESVLLPQAERRLVDGGIRELDGRPLTDEAAAACELGRELVRRLPPVDDPEVIRGDGCITCAAFGDACHGIEMEWWSDWERMHHASLDEG